MATDPRFGATMSPIDMPTEPKSKSSGCLKGCLIVAAIMVALAIIIGVVIALNWRKLAASGLSAITNQVIDQSELPAQEKAEVKAEVDRAVQAVRENRISAEQVGQLMEQLVQSPLFSTFIVSGIDKQYLEKSGLSDDEKTAGRQNVRRVWRGIIDKKIPEASIDSLMRHIADKDQQGHWQMRKQVSDADLRAFLDEAKSEADKAQIPEQPADIDVSDEVKRMIDAVLGPR